MAIPLPHEMQAQSPPFEEGHPGLRWEKHFDQWGESFTKPPDGAKKQWIELFCYKKPDASNRRVHRQWGNEDQLKSIKSRRSAMFEAIGAQTETLELQSSFVTGLGYEHPVENGFLWHPVTGTPYLPGSSIKGVLRAWAREYEQRNDVGRLFGSPELGAGTLIVFEALPVAPVTLHCEIVTPHDGGWRIREGATPSDWNSPVPIPFLAIAKGARFQFAIGTRRGGEAEDAASGMALLKEALDWLGAGAKTNIGFGRFEDAERTRRRRDAAERERQEQAAAAESERVATWQPLAGSKATLGTEVVKIVSVEGEIATVDSVEEGGEIDVDSSELRPPPA